MRILSQNWYIDIPYEQSAFAIVGSDSQKSWSVYAYFEDKTFKLATYSSIEQAMKSLQQLRACSGDYYIFPIDEKEHWEGLTYVTSESI